MVYTPVSISGYNTSPPSDDGSQTASNEIKWSTIKKKLPDPLKTAIESIDTNVAAAFGKIFLNGSTDKSTNDTLVAGDHGSVIRATNAITLELTAAATLGDGWNCLIFNEGTDTVTIDPNGAELINGAATITLDNQYSFAIISCDGTDFAAAVKDFLVTDNWAGVIEFPTDKSYTLVIKAAFAGTITETTTKSSSGTCTATFKINTTALGGTANAVSSTEVSEAHASANAFVAGDDIVVTISSNSSCQDMSFNIHYTRTG